MKPFDIELAKQGKPVCTREGGNARILCFDATKDEYPIVALCEFEGDEYLNYYTREGKLFDEHDDELDLFMKSEKHIGYTWLLPSYNSIIGEIGIFPGKIFETLKDAEQDLPEGYVVTKLEWEE